MNNALNEIDLAQRHAAQAMCELWAASVFSEI